MSWNPKKHSALSITRGPSNLEICGDHSSDMALWLEVYIYYSVLVNLTIRALDKLVTNKQEINIRAQLVILSSPNMFS